MDLFLVRYHCLRFYFPFCFYFVFLQLLPLCLNTIQTHVLAYQHTNKASLAISARNIQTIKRNLPPANENKHYHLDSSDTYETIIYSFTINVYMSHWNTSNLHIFPLNSPGYYQLQQINECATNSNLMVYFYNFLLPFYGKSTNSYYASLLDLTFSHFQTVRCFADTLSYGFYFCCLRWDYLVLVLLLLLLNKLNLLQLIQLGFAPTDKSDLDGIFVSGPTFYGVVWYIYDANIALRKSIRRYSALAAIVIKKALQDVWMSK